MEKETRQNVSKILSLADIYQTTREVLHFENREDLLNDIRINKRITKYNLLQLCNEDPKTGIHYILYCEITKDAYNKYFGEKIKGENIKTNFRDGVSYSRFKTDVDQVVEEYETNVNNIKLKN